MMKDDNENDLKNKEDLHSWKAHGTGHIPLCGIFLMESCSLSFSDIKNVIKMQN